MINDSNFLSNYNKISKISDLLKIIDNEFPTGITKNESSKITKFRNYIKCLNFRTKAESNLKHKYVSLTTKKTKITKKAKKQLHIEKLIKIRLIFSKAEELISKTINTDELRELRSILLSIQDNLKSNKTLTKRIFKIKSNEEIKLTELLKKTSIRIVNLDLLEVNNRNKPVLSSSNPIKRDSVSSKSSRMDIDDDQQREVSVSNKSSQIDIDLEKLSEESVSSKSDQPDEDLTERVSLSNKSEIYDDELTDELLIEFPQTEEIGSFDDENDQEPLVIHYTNISKIIDENDQENVKAKEETSNLIEGEENLSDEVVIHRPKRKIEEVENSDIDNLHIRKKGKFNIKYNSEDDM